MIQYNKVFFIHRLLVYVAAFFALNTMAIAQMAAAPDWPVNDNKAVLSLSATLTENSATITTGLAWRIFKKNTESPATGKDRLSLVESAQGGKARFKLPPGDYILHVAYGRTGIVKPLTLAANENVEERIVLNAGGLKLAASLTNGTLDTNQLHFSVYADSSERPIMSDAKANTILRLNSGTYHVVCQYGAANATVRSTIRIEAGKLTEINVQLHAARVNLKLVNPADRTEIADINWAILNDSGDIVHETTGTNTSVVLSEGNYVALARYKNQTYQRDFSLHSGKNQNLAIAASAENIMDEEALD
ncbi:MAG: Hypothetical protein BHV28_07950 [Candidatus Tokpelaia hoelldobleri]|uniref:Uncharacterized protein n=1 Tax=Candidatus Tokpelaia hoelldobleri TaxID=1902579 RepID=A0A1U9JUE4_9HYPH|nr:MAG: Hypothetical protein BHV28_07950 [Candidatus Tokpelaia hoelldoblerii]